MHPLACVPQEGLFFDTNNAGIRLTFTEVSGDAQADHSTADDEEVTRGHLVSLELHFQCDRVPSNDAQFVGKVSIESLKMFTIRIISSCEIESGGMSTMMFPSGRRSNPRCLAIPHTRCPIRALSG